VGWLKNFIHNRNLASENLMRGYNTTTMVRHMPFNVGDNPAFKCVLPVAPAYPSSLNLPVALSL
jgi:hypothetical protein